MFDFWDWMVNIMDEIKDRTEYYAQWYQDHKEEVRPRNLEAVKKYREKKMKEDPEGFLERKRETEKKSSKKYYAKKRAEMTPEEIEERRRRNRESMRALRAKRKLEAEQAKQNGPA